MAKVTLSFETDTHNVGLFSLIHELTLGGNEYGEFPNDNNLNYLIDLLLDYIENFEIGEIEMYNILIRLPKIIDAVKRIEEKQHPMEQDVRS